MIIESNRIYSGADPEFIEGDVFKTIIPLTPQDAPQDDERIIEILKLVAVDEDDFREIKTAARSRRVI